MEKLAPVIREKCGTRNGYQAHFYYGETPCDPCKTANTARFRKWYVTAADNERARYKKNYANDEYKNRKRRLDANRRAKALENGYEEYTLEQVFEWWGTDCHICLEPIDLDAPRISTSGEGWELGLHLDHVRPISKGGADILDNVKPAHAVCNLKKSAQFE